MTRGATAELLVKACHLLAEAGLGTSTSGNVSGRTGDRILLTPTGVRLADVEAEALSAVDLDGRMLNDVKPTKESACHLAIYRRRPHVRAVVHVHPPCAVAVSALVEPGASALVPAMTPQFVMRAGKVPVLPYYAPGTEDLAEAVAGCDAARAMVLANHGVFAFADGFAGALGIVEEIEENCRAYLLAGGRGRTLTEAEVQALISRSM